MQVDVTFSGHDHKYERTCPVYKKACLDLDANGSATAPVHVVSGNAGFRLSWGYNPHTPPYWEAMALEHGYLRCEANKTFLGCEVRPGLTEKPANHILDMLRAAAGGTAICRAAPAVLAVRC